MEAIYSSPVRSIKLNEKQLQVILQHSETRQDCSLHIVLKYLARAIRQLKEFETIQIGKEELKVSLFANVRISDPKIFFRKFLYMIHILSMDARLTKKHQPFYIQMTNGLRTKLCKQHLS